MFSGTIFFLLQEAETMHKKAIEIKERILGSEVRIRPA